jgi:hypothetical protein
MGFSSSFASTPRGVGLRVRYFSTKLLCVLGVQSLPAAEFHGLGAGHAADGISTEKMVQNIETNVPARGAPGDETAIDAVP